MKAALKLVALHAESAPRPLRVAVAANDRFARVGLTALLERFDDLRVIGDVDLDARLASRVRVMNPDVLLVDGVAARTDGMHDLDVPSVVIVTNRIDAAGAFAAGATAVLLRNASAEKLRAAIYAAANDLIVSDADAVPPMLDRHRRAGEELEEPLTHRELEVMQHLAAGRTNRDIASALGVTEHTVKFHVNSILAKLGAESRTEAVVRAARLGIIVI